MSTSQHSIWPTVGTQSVCSNICQFNEFQMKKLTCLPKATFTGGELGQELGHVHPDLCDLFANLPRMES